MKPFVMLMTASVLLGASPAQACGYYGPEHEKRERKEQKRYLEYTDRVVDGVWREAERDKESNIVSGAILIEGKGKTEKISLTFFPEINCGFPSFPQNGDKGTFYLRAEISTNDYFNEELEYDLLHFQRRERR
ncbi:hypothetical protein [Erythrobacter sp. SG61-1L]|uniref:hypothetical protein n=1 Tax=Erythrobacter sp. SG61-1L TaxID=1603897 RepID=UPI000AB96057|nr:hypothetical protein [Erythrobacter sp. SG61-1L]